MKINSNYSLRNILVATDFSPGAWQAIKVSAGLASNCDCKVFIVHVQSDEVDETDTRYMEHLNKIKEDVSQIAIDLSETYKFRIESAVLSGNVTAELNRFVKENDIDLILMGANSSFDGHVGSQTTLMIESSKAPVLVIPPAMENEKKKWNNGRMKELVIK